MNYIIESHGESNPILQAQRKKTFRASRFLNDPLLYPKDQRIFTVLLVVAQILFLIEKKGYNAIRERVERLKSYANRQLKKEVYFRLIQFIRLLQQLDKAEYKVENLSNVDKYYDRLVDTPFAYRGQITELEVIPYEKLWNFILKRL